MAEEAGRLREDLAHPLVRAAQGAAVLLQGRGGEQGPGESEERPEETHPVAVTLFLPLPKQPDDPTTAKEACLYSTPQSQRLLCHGRLCKMSAYGIYIDMAFIKSIL